MGRLVVSEEDRTEEMPRGARVTALRSLSFGSEPVRSLRWRDGELIDDIGGGRALAMDGTVSTAVVTWAFPFDHAAVSPSGRYVVLCQRLGTKAIVTEGRRVVRELDRSFYHADAYEYPLCVFALPDGREVVAHCPDHYNVIEIDDLETGERLTTRDVRGAADVFHSRLAASPGGRHLLSAGWVWHPYGVFGLFDVAAALDRPQVLDESHPIGGHPINGEVQAACWLDDDRVVVATTHEEALDADAPGELAPGEVGVWSIEKGRWEARSPQPDPPVGSMVPLGPHVLGLYEHPKLVDPLTGAVLAAWPEIASGHQDSAIIRHLDPMPPPFAVDPAGRRFAVADGADVLVAELPADTP